MASSIASYIVLNKDLSTGRDVATEVPFEIVNREIHIPKLTSVNKIGGILCNICESIFGNKKDFETHYKAHNVGEIVFTCVACKKQHSEYPSFRNHCYLQHIVKHKFGCQQCSKTFSKQSALNAHVTAIHDFKCGECGEKFKSKKDLQIHKIIHNKKAAEDPPYNCMKCTKVITSIAMCEDHLNDHCEVLYPCPICAMVLPNKTEATIHLSIHFDEKPLEISNPSNIVENSSIEILGGILCCHCDELFKNRTEIDSHFAAEHDDKVVVYSCNICEKHYTKYTLFGNHCHFHTAKDKFKCEECNRLFPRLPLLVMHNLAFHSEGAVDKPYRCDSCIYGFKSHYRLIEHKRLVHDEVTIKCQTPGCTSTFNTPSELVNHQREHKSCLDNWCRQCGLQFATLAACERHLDLHRRKQYVCPVCSRAYRERYLIVKHLPKHFESVLHICKVCGRSYSARNRFIEHAKTHSELKKHKCTYCSKTFLRSYEVEQHERVHTGHKPYHCTVCFKTFASYPNWTKHLTRAHAFDKNMIKEVREARKQTLDHAKTSPVKAESGIESAGSEVSDLYGLLESDDSADDGPIKRLKTEINLVMENIGTDKLAESSITDTVNAAIERIDIDENLIMSPVEDLSGSADFNEFPDDSSDIKAIVEHIDALSGGLEMPASQPDMLPYAEMQPLQNVVYDAVPVYQSQPPAPQYYQPTSVPLEYGPDFNTLGAEAYADVVNLDDHELPHIDPLLTIKAEQSKMYQPNMFAGDVPAYDPNWQPIITKVYNTYEEANDNRMYVLNGNIF